MGGPTKESGLYAALFLSVLLGFALLSGVHGDVVNPLNLNVNIPTGFHSLSDFARQDLRPNDTFVQDGLLKEPEKTECRYLLDLFYIQDVTDSFDDDVLNVKKQIPDLLKDLEVSYPGSRMGFGTFIDKPVPGVGDFDPEQVISHCLHVETPLDDNFERVAKVFATYGDGLVVQGGFDDPEVQLEAMLRAALSKTVKWSEGEFDPATGRPIVRIIILSTDTFTQPAGALYVKFVDALERNIRNCRDVYKGIGPDDIRENDLLYHPEILDEDANADCGVVDYPALSDVGEALRRRNIVPIFLVSAGGDFLPEGYKSKPDFTNTMGMKDYPLNTFTVYQQYIREMGVQGIIENIDQVSANFRERVTAAIAQAVELRCIPPSTTSTTTTTTTKTPAKFVTHQVPQPFETHEVPETLRTHEVPQTFVTHQVPQTFETHEVPQTFVTHQVPQTFVTHQVPQPFETHEVPQPFETHQVPQTFVTHQVPQTFVTHEVPQPFETHQVPQTFVTHQVPQTFETHEVPQTFETHEVPQTFETHEVPETLRTHEVATLELHNVTTTEEGDVFPPIIVDDKTTEKVVETEEIPKTSTIAPKSRETTKKEEEVIGEDTTKEAVKTDRGDKTTTSTPKPTTTSESTDATTEAAGGGAAMTTIVSSAVGGAVSAAAIGGLIYAKQMGLIFSNSSVPQIDANIMQDVDVPDVQVDREAYEVVTADAFA